MRVELRYRADSSESIEERHIKIMSGFYAMPRPWGVEEANAGPLPDIRGELQVDYALQFPEGAIKKAKMHYVFRGENYLKDKGHYDDALFIDLDVNESRYKPFLKEVLPAYIELYKPYRCVVSLDEDLVLDDWDEVSDMRERMEKNIDGRDTVYRIHSVNYFDRELCDRAFGLTPEEIVGRLEGKVESVSLIEDGVLLVYSSELLARDALEKIDGAVRPLLS